MIVLGIDEAGYGPMLGPLVVSGVAFSAPDSDRPPDFWKLLSTSVCRKTSSRDVRLAIDDSKKLYNPKIGIAALERAALTVLRTFDQRPDSLRAMISDIGTSGLNLDAYPWYRGFDLDLPVTVDEQTIALSANAIRRDMQAAGISLQAVRLAIILEGDFNRKVSQTHNKSVVLADAALRLAAVAASQRDRKSLRVLIDRHGGRRHYRDTLMTFFSPRRLRIVEESDARSAYELTDGLGCWTIEFLVKGDQQCMPIALASIYSKYLRELLMMGLNRFFRDLKPELKATAGYYTDAKRFLADVEPLISSRGLNRQMLVRCR